jgi:hypothetical protein
MPSRKKDGAPAGGWDCPAVNGRGDPRPATHYAVPGRNGKWAFKPIDKAYLDWCAEQQRIANGEPKPAIRVRTRKKS